MADEKDKPKEKESETMSLLKHDLDVKRFELEKDKFELDKKKFDMDLLSKHNEKSRLELDTLKECVAIVKYLNNEQHGVGYTMDEGHQRTKFDMSSRCLNGHEEDLYNTALIRMKRIMGFTGVERATNVEAS